MVRFIDLGNQIYPLSTDRDSFMFAWYNTVIDVFETYGDNQIWETWEEFENDLHYERGLQGIYDIERYKPLFPKDWPRGVGEEENA